MLSFTMNEFKTILTKLKEILSGKDQSSKKIRDKDIAAALNLKPTTLASYKSRNKAPYQAILTYCHNNRLDIRKLLFDEDKLVINYSKPVEAVADGKVRVRYFRNLDAYSRYLGLQ